MWICRWLFWTSVFFFGSCAPSEKYLGPKQSPPISHNDLKKDGAQLLLSKYRGVPEFHGVAPDQAFNYDVSHTTVKMKQTCFSFFSFFFFFNFQGLSLKANSPFADQLILNPENSIFLSVMNNIQAVSVAKLKSFGTVKPSKKYLFGGSERKFSCDCWYSKPMPT